jgi:hypothetical protein
MGLKPDEQNKEQAPGEGSNRAARLGFIVLVQAHYWQGQSACGGMILRHLAAEERGKSAGHPAGGMAPIEAGWMSTRHQDLQGGAPAQAGHPTALSHAERLQQPSGHHLDPTGDGGHRSRGQAASLSRTRCHSPRRRRENPPTRAQGCGSAALA